MRHPRWDRPLGSQQKKLVAEVRKAAAETDTHGRAHLLEEVVSAVHDAVEFDSPEGQGLANVLDCAISHRDNI